MAIRTLPTAVIAEHLPRSLRQCDFALLWSGQTTSLIGDGIYTIALALEALRLSNHASTLSLVLAARTAPAVAAMLLAGVLVDRLPRRLVVLGADLSRGLGVAAIAGLTAAHALTVPELIAISAVIGLGDAFFYPAYSAIVPEVLPSELLAQGNAFNSASQVLGGSLAGPAIAGVLIAAFGTAAAFGADAGSFLVSAACLVVMRKAPAPAATSARMLADAKAGLRWVRRRPWLWYGILAVAVLNFAAFSPLTVLAPLLVRDVLHEGAVVYGLVFAVSGAAGGVAALVVGCLGAPRRIVTVTWAAWGAGCLAVFGLSFAPDVVSVAVLLALAFAMLTVGNLLWHTMMQKLVPAHMLGRASSVDWLFSLCLTPLGVLVAGVLATSVGVRGTLLLGGAVATAASLVVVSPRVREPDCSGLFGRSASGSSNKSHRKCQPVLQRRTARQRHPAAGEGGHHTRLDASIAARRGELHSNEASR
jgi:MFS family permease